MLYIPLSLILLTFISEQILFFEEILRGRLLLYHALNRVFDKFQEVVLSILLS